MLNMKDIMETVQMIEEEHLDIRTITMGISLLSCCDPDIDRSCQKVYDKITAYAKDLVQVGEQIEAEYGIPIINKRISVTPHRYAGGGLRRGSGEICTGFGPCGQGCRSQLYWRIFGAGAQGLCRRG